MRVLTKGRQARCGVCVAATLLLIATSLGAGPTAGADWLRIDRPGPDVRAALPASAIDYGRFVWLPESAAPGLAGRPGTVRVTSPFMLTAGERRFDPLTDFPAGAGPWFTGSGNRGADFQLIQFEGPIKPAWLDELRALGIEPVQYLHPFTYIVWAEPGRAMAARGLSRVRWNGEFLPAFRVPVQSRTTRFNHPRAMALIYRPAQSGTIDELTRAGVEVVTVTALNSRFSVVELHAGPERYLDLARIPGVFTVQQIGQDAGTRGEMSNQSIAGGFDAENVIVPGYLDWLDAAGLDGFGVVVGIVDDGMETSHPDLSDNIVPCTGGGGSCSTAATRHGTHVAGAVAGSGASGVIDANGFLRGQGAAPAASLVPQRFPPLLGSGPGGMTPEGMVRIFRDSADSGARLVNNSWGPTSTPQGYDIPTMEVDMVVRNADPDSAEAVPILPVWAIMNGSGDSFGDCAPSSLGSPDEAKNLFAVGSAHLQNIGGQQLDDVFSVSGNSAHGPACDGRRVPHIVAPGCRTDSSMLDDDTNSDDPEIHGLMCGTSMAAPVVTGAIALFIEQYRIREGGDPSPALVKAVFTAAATDLAGNTDADGSTLAHRPDRKQGWGRIDLNAVINPEVPLITVDQNVVLTHSGENWIRRFTPVVPDKPMRIMLAWTDAPGPGTGGNTPAWVNNLDLIAEIDQQLFYGNDINPANGFSRPGGEPDYINNLEGIMLHPAQHQGATVVVEVLAANLAGDGLNPWDPGPLRQDFALACYNCMIEPDFTFELEPAAVSVCAPAAESIDIAIGALGGFNDPVELNTLAAPEGVTTGFTQSEIIPPGQSRLDIEVGANATPGSATVRLEAASSSAKRERTVGLEIFDRNPDTPALFLPIGGAREIAVQPEFAWSAAAQAEHYLLEVATDPGFEGIVFKTVTTETELTPKIELPSGSELFWRVSVANACGGAESETLSFITGPAPGQCPFDTEIVTVFADDLEAGQGAWIVEHGEDAVNNTWQLSQDRVFIGTRSWHARNLDEISDQRLVSPAIELPGSGQRPLTLSFRNFQEIESADGDACWDAGILEISTDDGATWSQIGNDKLLTQPYSGTVNEFSSGPNPLTGLHGWCGDPAPWTDNQVDLSEWAGSEIRLRFRLGTDGAVGREGWYIDDIRVRSCKSEVLFADFFEVDG